MAARHRQLRERGPLVSEAMVPWIPMLVGVVIMAGYVIYAIALSVGERPPAALPTDLGGALPAPPITTGPGADAGDEPGDDFDDDLDVAAVLPARALPRSLPPPPPPPPKPSPTPPPTPPAPPEPSEPESELVGKYRLDASYPYVFIGKVVIINRSDRAEDWLVELEFPSNVGKLNTFWVDGTPQPTMERAGDGYVFTSTVPVEPDSWVVLKFHFNRTGKNVDPTVCTVNGIECLLK